MTEDWRLRALESIRNPESLTSKARATNKFIIQAHCPPTFVHLFDRATRELDWSQAAWVRRALSIPLSRQTGVPLEEILATTTQPRRLRSSRLRYPEEGRGDTGHDMHLFCLHPGCTGHGLE